MTGREMVMDAVDQGAAGEERGRERARERERGARGRGRSERKRWRRDQSIRPTFCSKARRVFLRPLVGPAGAEPVPLLRGGVIFGPARFGAGFFVAVLVVDDEWPAFFCSHARIVGPASFDACSFVIPRLPGMSIVGLLEAFCEFALL